eukprot:RCo041042
MRHQGVSHSLSPFFFRSLLFVCTVFNLIFGDPSCFFLCAESRRCTGVGVPLSRLFTATPPLVSRGCPALCPCCCCFFFLLLRTGRCRWFVCEEQQLCRTCFASPLYKVTFVSVCLRADGSFFMYCSVVYLCFSFRVLLKQGTGNAKCLSAFLFSFLTGICVREVGDEGGRVKGRKGPLLRPKDALTSSAFVRRTTEYSFCLPSRFHSSLSRIMGIQRKLFVGRLSVPTDVFCVGALTHL